ncbi:hypothetical protein MRX96_055227 [Rhipicephalus microplus]
MVSDVGRGTFPRADAQAPTTATSSEAWTNVWIAAHRPSFWVIAIARESVGGPGDGVTCDSNVLRFPFFADVSPGADGHVRCVRASAATLLTHRCLIGSNRFSSDEACKRACVDGATLRRSLKEGDV